MKFLITSLIFPFTLLSCAPKTPQTPQTPQTPKPKTEASPPKPEPPKLVGKIASIPPDKRFVLIQSYGKWTSEAGRILTTRGPDERTANLRVTGEALGEFAAADVQSGQVEIGDGVYSLHTLKKPLTPLTTPEPESPAQTQPKPEIPKNN